MSMYKRMNGQQQRFFRQSLILLVIVFCTTLIMGYLGRFPTSREFTALGKALILPDKQGVLVMAGQEYHFPLPANTSLLETQGEYQQYLTLAVGEKLRNYYEEILPESGWVFLDQLGSGFIFTQGEVKLICTRHGLMRGMEVVTFTLKQNSLAR